MTPDALCFWRVAGGALTFGVLALVRHGRALIPTRRDLLFAVFLSLMGVTLNQLFYLQGLRQSSAVRGGLLVMLIPIFTLSYAVLRRKERATPPRVLGVLSAVAGVLVLLGGSLLANGFSGDGLFLINAACYAIYLVEVRALLQRKPALVVAAWVFLLAVPPVALIAANDALLPTMSSAECLALIWVVVFPTIFAYLLNIYALQRLPASTTAVFVCTQPLLAALLAMTLLGERISWIETGTFVLVAGGVWLTSRDSSARSTAKS